MLLKTLLPICVGAACLAAWDNPSSVHVIPRAAARKVRTARPIRVETKLVLIPVTVTDRFGAPFGGLPREAFRLFEDGVEQRVKYFSFEDAPISLGVVFDASRSMDEKLATSRQAVARFFSTSVPGDEYLVVEFSDSPRVLRHFTPDTEEIERALAAIQPKNWTALLDAVYVTIQQMDKARNARKALLIVSDGADNNSRYTESEMRAIVREADVCIYSLALGGGLLNRHTRLLRRLSQETGGLTCDVEKPAELPAAVEKISAAIRNQYVLGYSSSNPDHDGLYRKVQVTLQAGAGNPPLRASWRAGYYAPAPE